MIFLFLPQGCPFRPYSNSLEHTSDETCFSVTPEASLVSTFQKVTTWFVLAHTSVVRTYFISFAHKKAVRNNIRSLHAGLPTSFWKELSIGLITCIKTKKSILPAEFVPEASVSLVTWPVNHSELHWGRECLLHSVLCCSLSRREVEQDTGCKWCSLALLLSLCGLHVVCWQMARWDYILVHDSRASVTWFSVESHTRTHCDLFLTVVQSLRAKKSREIITTLWWPLTFTCSR